uniref:Cystatin-B n=1 Tax=Stegastes partitus TaxID=144197 RepID=A0A3B4ZU07_9TELE
MEVLPLKFLNQAKTETTNETESLQQLYNNVKSHIQEQTNKMSEEFRAVTYREQIMAGTDYFITVHAGGSSYLHMIVSGKLLCPGGKCELTGVEEGHTKDDPLEPF